MSAIRAELDRDFDQFCSHAAKFFAAPNLDIHLVHQFALVHTAFRMAVRLKVLRSTAAKSTAIWRVFRRYMDERPHPMMGADLITAVAQLPDVLEVNAVSKAVGKSELQGRPAFIKTFDGGRRELWVPTARKKRFLTGPCSANCPTSVDCIWAKARKTEKAG